MLRRPGCSRKEIAADPRPSHPLGRGLGPAPQMWRLSMNKHALILGIGAGLLLTAGTASAGTCSAEIEALQKAIQSAGSVALANQAPSTSIQQGANASIATNSPT